MPTDNDIIAAALVRQLAADDAEAAADLVARHAVGGRVDPDLLRATGELAASFMTAMCEMAGEDPVSYMDLLVRTMASAQAADDA